MGDRVSKVPALWRTSLNNIHQDGPKDKVQCPLAPPLIAVLSRLSDLGDTKRYAGETQGLLRALRGLVCVALCRQCVLTTCTTTEKLTGWDTKSGVTPGPWPLAPGGWRERSRNEQLSWDLRLRGQSTGARIRRAQCTQGGQRGRSTQF